MLAFSGYVREGRVSTPIRRFDGVVLNDPFGAQQEAHVSNRGLPLSAGSGRSWEPDRTAGVDPKQALASLTR